MLGLLLCISTSYLSNNQENFMNSLEDDNTNTSSDPTQGCTEFFTSNKVATRFLFNNKRGSPRLPPKVGEVLCFKLNIAHLSYIQLKSNYGGNMFSYLTENQTIMNHTEIYPSPEYGISSEQRSIMIMAAPKEDPKDDSYIDIDSFPIYYMKQSYLSNLTGQEFGLNYSGKSGTMYIIIALTILGIVISGILTFLVREASEDFC